MYPESLEDAKKIFSDVKKVSPKIKRTNIVLCPPFVYLSSFADKTKSPLFLGAQNTNSESSGSQTGEVSVSQLAHLGLDYVIVGHSERRKMGETDEVVNKKAKAVLNYGMNAIVCIGETTRDSNGDYLNFRKHQILLSLRDIPKKFADKIVVAYEPVWAIGAKEAQTPRDLHEMSIYIRKILNDLFGDFAGSIPIIYGGAVDRVNADSLVREGNVSGLLIGRQSLNSKDFVEIIKLVDNI